MRPHYILLVALLMAAFGGLAVANRGAQPVAPAPSAMHVSLADWQGQHPFRLTSTTFANNTEVPQGMVYHGTLGSVCTGANESPELSWTRPWFARSFAVVLFDVTANFGHWGIYNIAPDRTGLPTNAGVSGSTYGSQVVNDAGNVGYSGPCPPPGLVHQYVFTVYALDSDLHLQSSTQFPATIETLYRAMIGHVLQTASLTGLYSD